MRVILLQLQLQHLLLPALVLLPAVHLPARQRQRPRQPALARVPLQRRPVQVVAPVPVRPLLVQRQI